MRDELKDVTIVLAPDGGEKIVLSPEQAAAALARLPELAREARKWRAMTGRPGQLVVIDQAIVESVREVELGGREP